MYDPHDEWESIIGEGMASGDHVLAGARVSCKAAASRSMFCEACQVCLDQTTTKVPEILREGHTIQAFEPRCTACAGDVEFLKKLSHIQSKRPEGEEIVLMTWSGVEKIIVLPEYNSRQPTLPGLGG